MFTLLITLITIIYVTVLYEIFNKLKRLITLCQFNRFGVTKFSNIKFKHQFKNLNFYSMPESTSIAFRRRLLNLYLFASLIIVLVYTIL